MINFSDLNLSDSISRAITDLGFEKPSPIQVETLPILLGQPTDFIGLAATGTGKTAAFAIPLLEKIDPTSRKVQSLILCPTRELALQVAGQIDLLGKYLGIRSVAIYGGAGYHDQIRGLKDGASVVVGTPGRIVDHLTRGTLNLKDVKTLILDEADEMISMGFKDDLEFVLGALSRDSANTWLFSATMSPSVRDVAANYLRDPQQVQVNRAEMVPSSVEQIYYATAESNKPEIVCKVIDAAEDFYGIIFCQTKSLVAELHQFLARRGYHADCLHGDMDQNGRERVMKAFRERKVTVLIATDVACRGLDVKDITHVVNYSIPRELDSYVHRIGRTGRSGKTGIAISLVTNSHRGLIGRIERMTRSKMKEGKIPTRKEIGAKKVLKTLESFQAQNHFARAAELMGTEWQSALESLPKEELAARFISLIHPDIFSEKAVAEAKVEISLAPRKPAFDRPSFDRPKKRGEFSRRPERGERSERRERSERAPGDDSAQRADRDFGPWGAKKTKSFKKPGFSGGFSSGFPKKTKRPERAGRPERFDDSYKPRKRPRRELDIQ